jgi:hypothetical protein
MALSSKQLERSDGYIPAKSEQNVQGKGEI